MDHDDAPLRARRTRTLGAVLLFVGVGFVVVTRVLGLGDSESPASPAAIGSGPLQVLGLVLAFVGAFLAARRQRE